MKIVVYFVHLSVCLFVRFFVVVLFGITFLVHFRNEISNKTKKKTKRRSKIHFAIFSHFSYMDAFVFLKIFHQVKKYYESEHVANYAMQDKFRTRDSVIFKMKQKIIQIVLLLSSWPKLCFWSRYFPLILYENCHHFYTYIHTNDCTYNNHFVSD